MDRKWQTEAVVATSLSGGAPCLRLVFLTILIEKTPFPGGAQFFVGEAVSPSGSVILSYKFVWSLQPYEL